MSAALERTQLRVTAPPGWYSMPDPAAPGARVWPYEVVGRLRFHGQDAVSAVVSFADALDRAGEQARPKRLRWVLLGEPAVPVVQAWARLDVVPRIEPDPVTAADLWAQGARTSEVGAGGAVWRREVERRTLHADPAAVIHDLLAVRSAPAAEPTLQHRVVVTIFPVEPIVLSLSVSTPLLAAVPDLEATALGLADGVVIGAPL